MANEQTITLQRVRFINNFIEGKPTQYVVKVKSQNVITGQKLIKNIADHAGLPTTLTEAILNALNTAINDYLAAGHAVQVENLCTFKPKIKGKAKEDVNKVNARRYKKEWDAELNAYVENDGCIKTVGLNVYPIGDTRAMIDEFKFTVEAATVQGTSSDSEGDENEETGGGDQGGEQQGGENQGGEDTTPTPTLYTLTFRHNGSTYETQQYEAGATVTPPTPPTGYFWLSCPSKMPASDRTVESVEDTGGDPDDI